MRLTKRDDNNIARSLRAAHAELVQSAHDYGVGHPVAKVVLRLQRVKQLLRTVAVKLVAAHAAPALQSTTMDSAERKQQLLEAWRVLQRLL